jgi:PAS domain S-box-containing protein
VAETYGVFRRELLALAAGHDHAAGETRLRRLDGTLIDVVFTMALPRRTGHADSVLVTLIDVTDRRRAEQALREMQRHLEAVLDYSPSVIFIKDWEGRHILINRHFANLNGIRIEDVIGKTDYDIFPREVADTLRQNDLDVLQGGRPCEIEEIVPHADGLHTYISTKFPLRDADGNCYAVCGIATDITERKRAENELRASREELRQLADRVLVAREEEATRIARELHDELSQALTSILLDLSFLEETCFDDRVADRQMLLPRIRSAIKLASSTIDDVRRIATELRPALLDDFGLVAAIEWQSQQFEQRTGIHCEVRTSLRRHQLPSRPSTALFRILQEALINVARHAGASKVSVSLAEADGCVHLTIEDDGRGITEVEQTSTRSLGLASMRERSRLLGGETRISGLPGVGTTIRVSIPLPDHGGDE